jgi:hypothetical protein
MARFDPLSGLLTEYEVPSSPLAITLWLALDPGGNVWFTEWATGKIAMVNTSTNLPFSVSVSNSSVDLLPAQSTSLTVTVNVTESPTSPLRLSVAGMTSAGLSKLTAQFAEDLVVAAESGTFERTLSLRARGDLEPSSYTILVSASEPNLIRSVLIGLRMGGSGLTVPDPSLIAVSGFLAVIAGATVLLYRRRKVPPKADRPRRTYSSST